MRRLQILMDEELDDALERRARKERTSKSELIRRFVGQHLRRLPPIEEDPIWLMATADPFEPDPVPDVEANEVDRVVYLEEIDQEMGR